MKEAGDKTIVFTNFVDFDSSQGHRRDIASYAAGLELFDRRLPELMELVGEDDILILTADHGCDPSWQGTDHTREHIPVLVCGPKLNRARWGHLRGYPARPRRNTGTSDMEYGRGHVLRSLPGGAMLTGPVVVGRVRRRRRPAKTTI